MDPKPKRRWSSSPFQALPSSPSLIQTLHTRVNTNRVIAQTRHCSQRLTAISDAMHRGKISSGERSGAL
ncbi:hypothetical protein DdX_16918 [Ditylenchus destructor]|uniref:Uncharacterized protein n=1 Tax=Ditylenchus destructor TaxID=166010 RepID=A0AAD4MPY6_9BILA|nr:hypothetical protein DdX_16918 [Ditylenchus destructor]